MRNKIIKLFGILIFVSFVLTCKEKEVMTPIPEPKIKPELVFKLDTIVEEKTNLLKIEVTLNGKHDTSISIPYKTKSNSAKNEEDYITLEEELVFPASSSNSTAYLSIEVLDDDIFEEMESFTVEFSPDTNVIANEKVMTITIMDNDLEYTDNDYPGYVTKRNKEDWELIWSDEFDNEALDLNEWTQANRGNWYNNEVQYYQPQNTAVQNGLLTITAKKEVIDNHNYTSSRIWSHHKVFYQYGQIDIRAKLPYSQGLWPALWMMGENIDTVSWPACGEIDIMELKGHTPNTISSTIHFKNNSGNHQFPPSKEYKLSKGDFSDEFHVFSMIWNPYKIEFYVDDEKYNTVFFSSLNLPFGENPFQKPFYILMNVAVGGDFGGNPDQTTLWPQKMDVDYVRVYQKE